MASNMGSKQQNRKRKSDHPSSSKHNRVQNRKSTSDVVRRRSQSQLQSSSTSTPIISSSSISVTTRPLWAPSTDIFPWSSTAAIYGDCAIVSSYEKIGRIGEGTYGVVYQARDKRTGSIVALKRCLPHHEASDGFPLTTLREITILRELQSAGGQEHGIIGLKDVTVSSR
mmetsp:Transcript_37991/g.79585  ORF Transcript_37991/g.79585 Transcript_37991/m.79585 type:complete len:170 (+) Transcript_37991:212-721(+)